MIAYGKVVSFKMTRITIYDVDAEFISNLAEENDCSIADVLEEIIYAYKETME